MKKQRSNLKAVNRRLEHREKSMETAQQTVSYNQRFASRRPMKGAGVGGADIFRPDQHSQDLATSVDDDRRHKTFCRDCGAETTHVKVGEEWSVRNVDGLPHALTCEGDTP